MKNNAFLWFSLGALCTNSIYLIREGDVGLGVFFLGLAACIAFCSGWYASRS